MTPSELAKLSERDRKVYDLIQDGIAALEEAQGMLDRDSACRSRLTTAVRAARVAAEVIDLPQTERVL